MADRPDATRIARLVIDRFEGAGIETALGGALCLGFWATPRGTLDVDLTAFLREAELDRGLDALESLGAVFDADQARRTVAERGLFDVRLSGVRVDIFIPDIPLHESARARRRTVEFAGRPTAIWSAEDLVIFKLMYFRTKDKADIEAMYMAQGATFDVSYVDHWLEQLVGPEDERSLWFRSMVTESTKERTSPGRVDPAGQ